MSYETRSNAEEMMLDDDELETVSGGAEKAVSEMHYCPYCRSIHGLRKYTGWKVRYNGELFTGVKYQCISKSHGSYYQFYEFIDKYGNTVYLDKNNNIINK